MPSPVVTQFAWAPDPATPGALTTCSVKIPCCHQDLFSLLTLPSASVSLDKGWAQAQAHGPSRQVQMKNTHVWHLPPFLFSCSVMSDSFQPHGLQHASPFPVLQYHPEFVQTHVHWVSDAIQPSYPWSPPSPPALNLSQHQGLYYCASVHRIRWPKYWSFSFSISPSNEYSGLISFRIDWFELQAVSLLPGPNETPELLGRTCFLHHCMEKLVTKHGNAMKLTPIGQNLTKEKQETRRSPQVRTSLF